MRLAILPLLTLALATSISFAAEPTGDRTVVERMPGLVAFWTFSEEPGQQRRSSGTREALPLDEVNGPIQRVEGGPFSGYSAEFNGKQYLRIKYAETGRLNISGPDAQVSMFAVVRIIDLKQSRTIAGMWSEGKGANDDTGTRQYSLLMNMPTYGGPRQLTPHISSEGGVTRRADGSAFPWCADYAATKREVPEEEWCTLGFTYNSKYIRAYINGVLEERKLDAAKDKRTDPYFTQEGPGGKDRGMNPYYHGRGIFTYDPAKHDTTKPGGGADFTVAARYAVGSFLGEATKGRFGGLAVFDRALTDAEMLALHNAAGIDKLQVATQEALNNKPPRAVSGIYPHLAMFNDEGECGTGAVVPWTDRLWAITYAPHKPEGSSDKLYEITPTLRQIVRPESVGGTPANRMLHRESRQLFIGPYVIDDQRRVRVLTPKAMFGRLTGNARHLTDPANKIYFATMEEGLYEVDVASLAVTELWADEQRKSGRHADLPGYHGKGLYSGQGRVVYANNGDHAKEALSNPRVPSGVLASWDGKADAWTVVRRNQFTEVTGPGGLYGNTNPETDPIWSMGWDHRSLLLMVLEKGEWRTFRLPKASHSYDGAHGWNTEWPRIRDIGEDDLLMTMHGMFWRFPRTFGGETARGIRPRSAYLKVIGDFCRWNDRLVFGCDDTAKSEFLNKRKVKGEIEGPGQSQSNLWFTPPSLPDQLGPALASGSVWQREAIKQGDISDPFLFSGWQRRSAHFVNEGDRPTSFVVEIDKRGTGEWSKLMMISVPAGQSEWKEFGGEAAGEWIRVTAGADCAKATVHFTFGNAETRTDKSDAIFDGLAQISDESQIGGLVRARGENKRTLQLAARRHTGTTVEEIGSYELDAALNLEPIPEAVAHEWLKSRIPVPRDVVTVDAASILIVDDRGRRWRLPKTDDAYDAPMHAGQMRLSREVATERDLFQAHGTFYELPAENADGFAKLRPIATHRLRISDYCSYRGLLVLTGLRPNARAGEHIIGSSDYRAALWVGAIDDLWRLGNPRGTGGPWHNAAVKANQPSDPYLLWGYDRRAITLSHTSSALVTMTIEVDLTGEGLWVEHTKIDVAPSQTASRTFPAAFQARWLRIRASHDCTATALLEYE